MKVRKIPGPAVLSWESRLVRNVGPFLKDVGEFTLLAIVIASVSPDFVSLHSLGILAQLLAILGISIVVFTTLAVGSSLARGQLWRAGSKALRKLERPATARGGLRDDWLDGP